MSDFRCGVEGGFLDRFRILKFWALSYGRTARFQPQFARLTRIIFGFTLCYLNSKNMGPHIDAAVNDRMPFRLNPMDFAALMSRRNPRRNPDVVLDILPSGDFSIAPLDVTTDWNNRIDFDCYSGSRYCKLTGYVASIFRRSRAFLVRPASFPDPFFHRP